MKRKATWCVEVLEGRTLLSGITYNTTTDQTVYQVGQPIQFRMTETNTGDQPATAWIYPTDFTVSQTGIIPDTGAGMVGNTNWIWQSDPGNADAGPTSMTLLPGQSLTQTATWDGTTPDTVVSANGASTTYALNHWGSFSVSNPYVGNLATFQIADPLSVALTTNQSSYQMGQPVQMTDSETNNSDQTILVVPDPVAVLHNGEPVMSGSWPESDYPQPGVVPVAISPGQEISSQETWDGIPESAPYTMANLTGTFVAVYQTDSYTPLVTADFQIVPPPSGTIVSSVTTDQPVYQNGQSVTMTFTETNQGDQPVTVPAGPNGFATVVYIGSEYLYSSLSNGSHWAPSTGTEWTTLEPGQSWTQTTVWPIAQYVLGPYTDSITDVFDPNGNSASFELTADPLVPVAGPNTSPTQGPAGPDSSSPGQVSPAADATAPTVSLSTLPGQLATYELGRSIRITLTIPGDGSAKVILPRVKPLEHITVLDGTRVISRLTRRVPDLASKQLEAGRTVKLTQIWDGRPNQPGVHRLNPGTYTIDVVYGDHGGSAAIAMGRKGS